MKGNWRRSEVFQMRAQLENRRGIQKSQPLFNWWMREVCFTNAVPSQSWAVSKTLQILRALSSWASVNEPWKVINHDKGLFGTVVCLENCQSQDAFMPGQKMKIFRSLLLRLACSCFLKLLVKPWKFQMVAPISPSAMGPAHGLFNNANDPKGNIGLV